MNIKIEKLSKEPCRDFPHLICSETQGLELKNWCETCISRFVIKFLEKIKNEKSNI